MVDWNEETKQSSIRVYLCLGIIGLWDLLQFGNTEECYMPQDAISYMGSLNVTKTGKPCQYWDTDDPHTVSTTIRDENFPDGSKSAAKNFCRNPEPIKKVGTWCYTTDDSVEWEFCDACAGMSPISSADNNYSMSSDYGSCKLPERGARYMGTVAHSRNHFKCENWIDHLQQDYVFPDKDPKEAKNYCRNPLPKKANGPWCFVGGTSGLTMEYCDVCTPFSGELTKQSNIFYDYGITVGHLPPMTCIYWCIEFQSCVAAEVRSDSGLCVYFVFEGGAMNHLNGVDHYSIRRVCPARAKEKAVYFTIFLTTWSDNGFNALATTIEECEKHCIERSGCVMFDWDITKEQKCFLHDKINDKLQSGRKEVQMWCIFRCDPKLQPEDDSFPSEPLLSVPAPIQEQLSEIQAVAGNTTLSTSSKKLMPVMITIAAVLLLVCCFASITVVCIIRTSSKKPAQPQVDSRNERERLMPNTNQADKDKANELLSQSNRNQKTKIPATGPDIKPASTPNPQTRTVAVPGKAFGDSNPLERKLTYSPYERERQTTNLNQIGQDIKTNEQLLLRMNNTETAGQSRKPTTLRVVSNRTEHELTTQTAAKP